MFGDSEDEFTAEEVGAAMQDFPFEDDKGS